MTEIETSHGPLDDALLVKTEGVDDNDDYRCHWEEWRLGDEVVKRNASITLKKSIFAFGEANGVG